MIPNQLEGKISLREIKKEQPEKWGEIREKNIVPSTQGKRKLCKE